MRANFAANQTVKLKVPQLGVPIQHYLRQPQRLIHALVDSTRLQELAPDVFRLKMKPLSLLSFSVQPTVDLQIWSEADGTVKLRSLRSEILGIEYINQRFSLDLAGQLTAVTENQQTTLLGMAELQVSVELPPPLCYTPQALLKSAGDNLLKSVLLTIKQRMMHQLIQDYKAWVENTQAGMDQPLFDRLVAFSDPQS